MNSGNADVFTEWPMLRMMMISFKSADDDDDEFQEMGGKMSVSFCTFATNLHTDFDADRHCLVSFPG